MALVGITTALLLLLAAIVIYLQAQRTARATGLPTGRVIYSDTADWQSPETALFSRKYRLTGKPDYLVQTRAGLIPVEVKSGQAPADGQILPWHAMQLAAYCLLVEDQTGQTPPCGYLKYRDRTLSLDFTPTLRAQLLATLEAMRADAKAGVVHRSHEIAERCARCGVGYACGSERLAEEG